MIRKKENQLAIFLPYFFFFLLSFIFLGLEKINFASFIKKPLEVIFITPRKTLYLWKVSFSKNLSLLFNQDLRNKINRSDDYQREIEILKAKIKLLEGENQDLRRQLEAPLPASWDFIPAEILGKDRYLILDQGQKNGVGEGMAVIYQNQILGIITSVTPRTSRMMFLWDPDSKIPVKTERNVKGLLTGAFGNQIILRRVLQKEPLENFDLVLTSGEENLPPNLIVGKIEEIFLQKESVYKEARIAPLLDYNKLQHVFIVSAF